MSDQPNEIIAVTITAPDADWLADHIRELVERRLAACGNIVPEIRSIYRWQNKIEDHAEAYAVVHTRASRLDEIIAVTNQNHPYDTVHVIAHPIVDGDDRYSAWVVEQTT